MTQEDKELLVKDLCARLPYGVKVRVKNNEREREWYGVSGYDTTATTDSISKLVDSNFKPYLRPMSSMTTKEESDMYAYTCEIGNLAIQKGKEVNSFSDVENKHLELLQINAGFMGMRTDWLNTHHFDYRGLIEKGLALEDRDRKSVV